MAFQQQVLKQCTKILHEIECEKNEDDPVDAVQFSEDLQRRYQRYRQQKEEEHKAPEHEYHEFVALCSITADRDGQTPFLFQYTKLSFTIMCSNSDSGREVITLRAFEKWATKLHPLATKLNYKRVFLALATDVNAERDKPPPSPPTLQPAGGSDSSFSRLGMNQLRQRVVGYAQNSYSNRTASSKELNSNIQQKMNKSIYGGISMARFCGYVKALQHQMSIEERECGGMESLVSGHERILYHIRGVSDMTGLPPYYGFVILTDYHLIFQGTALTTKTTVIKLNDKRLEVEKAKIGGFLKRDTALKICSEQGTMSWNVVNIKSVRRDELFWSIWTMMKAHELAERCGPMLREEAGAGSGHREAALDEEMVVKLKRRIIVEAADDVLRQNALQSMLSNDERAFDAVPFVRYGTASQKKDYVLSLRADLTAIEERLIQHRSAGKGVIGSLFTGSLFPGRKGSDHSVSADTVDPDDAIRMRKYAALKSDFERESRAKALQRVNDERVEFDVMEFVKYIKVVRVELEPLVSVYRLYQCIIHWKNPGLSLMVLLALELVAYVDVVHYFPALLLIANSMLLVSFRRDQRGTVEWLEGILVFAGFDPSDFDQEKLAAEKYVNRKYGKMESGKESKDNGWNIMRRIKAARHQFSMTRFSMGFHQKKLADLSVFLGRFRTIYKWDHEDKSQKFCLLSLGLGIVLLVTSLRFVFSVIVFGRFFSHNPWRSERKRKSKGQWDRYFESIPPDIPAVDSDSGSDAEDDGARTGLEEEAPSNKAIGGDEDARSRQSRHAKRRRHRTNTNEDATNS